mmetsp:Transcript_3662/g.8372  ORF Transcript_3662/g.8372 Transcript_3662/m.8372 type:complete len:276 (-) Transcript_3662:250-1077(-)
MTSPALISYTRFVSSILRCRCGAVCSMLHVPFPGRFCNMSLDELKPPLGKLWVDPIERYASSFQDDEWEPTARAKPPPPSTGISSKAIHALIPIDSPGPSTSAGQKPTSSTCHPQTYSSSSFARKMSLNILTVLLLVHPSPSNPRRFATTSGIFDFIATSTKGDVEFPSSSEDKCEKMVPWCTVKNCFAGFFRPVKTFGLILRLSSFVFCCCETMVFVASSNPLSNAGVNRPRTAMTPSLRKDRCMSSDNRPSPGRSPAWNIFGGATTGKRSRFR